MKNIIPLISAVKQNKVKKIFICLVLLNYFSLSMTGFIYAATELSDRQLDHVYAEGIFFDFDVSFGSLSDLNSQLISPQKPASPTAVQSPNAKVKMLDPAKPLAPQNPQKPVLSSDQQESASSAPSASSQQTIETPQAIQVTQNLPSQQNSAEAPLQITLRDLPAEIFGGSDGLSAINASDAQGAPETTFSVDISPQNSSFPVTQSGSNNVFVGDQSQQYLSSLVNVNAAGSVVPVLLNIVVNINSKIENMSSVNNVDLSNYYRFQIRG